MCARKIDIYSVFQSHLHRKHPDSEASSVKTKFLANPPAIAFEANPNISTASNPESSEEQGQNSPHEPDEDEEPVDVEDIDIDEDVSSDVEFDQIW